MLHEPAAKSEHDPAASYKTRLGVWMFMVYSVVYAGFVAINLMKPALMEKRVIFGLNLAVVYGFFLIIAALLMALVYNRFCTRQETALKISSEPRPPSHEPLPSAASKETR